MTEADRILSRNLLLREALADHAATDRTNGGVLPRVVPNDPDYRGAPRQPAASAVPIVANAKVATSKAILIGLVSFLRRYSVVVCRRCGAFQRRLNSCPSVRARATHAHAIPSGAIHVHATHDLRAIRALASCRHRHMRRRQVRQHT